MKIFFSLLSASILLAGCANSNAQLKIEQAFPNLSFQQPVDIQNSGDGTNRLFVLEQKGIIWVFDNQFDVSSKRIFLDLTDRVDDGGEMGLLGLAFHPNYKLNGFFYLNYTVNNPRMTIISRFKVSADINAGDKQSEVILMQINQPYSNHNGGQISFGPDGYLYISLGDGGSGGDPQNNAQNLTSLLGKILRIDINHSENGKNYSIPTDNPFVGNSSGYKEEIYAYGLRNVWRFSFDTATKNLWGADVGQNSWEEINLIVNGGNYGWRCYEGNHTYNTSGCTAANYVKPVWEYSHNSDGGFSITGGFVYRGKSASELTGKYIYGDFVSRSIWALEYASNIKNSLLFKGVHAVSTFGVDENKELYFANYSSGQLYKFAGTPTSKKDKSELPKYFRLNQNFPNPFNPSTSISYQITQSAKVTLKVFELLGREVATLVDETLSPGIYNSRFLISDINLAGGVYLYRLTADDISISKKMTYLK